ncbi:MAG: FecR domain-containing protein [Bacteroidetes bacterium]|nr:FecR domain-containing protein [Bacteroidota bacterium]
MEEHIGRLFDRYYNKTATAEERQEFLSWLDRSASDEEVAALMRDAWENLGTGESLFGEEKGRAMLAAIFDERPSETVQTMMEGPAPVRRIGTGLGIGAVAAAVAAVVAAIWLFYPSKIRKAQPDISIPLAKKDIAPGGNKALLVLSDGSSIVLDSARNGVIGHQGAAVINKTSSGALAYEALATGANPAAAAKAAGAADPAAATGGPAYNRITTPRGGQYEVTLADGSKVWLNAASSLRFPSSFTGDRREVELTGEAYFEIAKNTAAPFVVKVGDDTRVQVLGTQFDVMAYDDEQVLRTTLLEGAVKVAHRGASSLLRPGQQARFAAASSAIDVVEEGDMEEAVAWKNGLFEFNRADIHTIMRQIARWYDVDVRYEGKPPAREFVGKVSRNANVSEVLRILELSHIHFRIEGKTIVVVP